MIKVITKHINLVLIVCMLLPFGSVALADPPPPSVSGFPHINVNNVLMLVDAYLRHNSFPTLSGYGGPSPAQISEVCEDILSQNHQLIFRTLAKLSPVDQALANAVYNAGGTGRMAQFPEKVQKAILGFNIMCRYVIQYQTSVCKAPIISPARRPPRGGGGKGYFCGLIK